MNFLFVKHYFPLKELLYSSVIIWVLFTVIGIAVCTVIIIAVKRKVKRMETEVKDNDKSE